MHELGPDRLRFLQDRDRDPPSRCRDLDTAHFLSFHFALPEVITKDDGSVEHVPLQPDAYWVTGQNGFRYQVEV